MLSNKRERASQQKKEKAMERTINLLLKKGGPDSISTSDICAATKLKRSSLYHYFGSKKNLILSVHVQSFEKILKPYLEKAVSIDAPLERLIYMIRTFTKETICLHPELRILIHDQLTMKDKYFHEVRAEWKKHYLLLRDTITELQSKSVVGPKIKASWAALFVLGMLTWITYWFDYNRKDQIDEISDAALQIIFSGLGIKNELLPCQ